MQFLEAFFCYFYEREKERRGRKDESVSTPVHGSGQLKSSQLFEKRKEKEETFIFFFLKKENGNIQDTKTII